MMDPKDVYRYSVIPTKVGIQRLADWIPTFVGMTVIAGLFT